MVEEAKKAGGNGSDEDVLTYAMFPNVAPKFFQERSKGPVDAKTAFAAKPVESAPKSSNGGSYSITVNGVGYNVSSDGKGNISVNGTPYNVSFANASGSAVSNPSPAQETPKAAPVQKSAPAAQASSQVTGGVDVLAPVAGTLLRYAVSNGSNVNTGDTIMVLESMKMELEVKASASGVVTFVAQEGTQVQNGQKLASIGGTVSSPVQTQAVQTPSQSAPSPVQASSGGKPVNSPVAGTLLRYAVNEGDSVSSDTTVIVIESMKMELEIKAGSSGRIHFTVPAGSQVANGQVVADLQ